MSLPLVSVVVPTHNRPEMLAEALASVRAQTFTDYEIIVVSNGENDDMRGQSRACATSYGARYFELSEGNVSIARNYGVNQAYGEWIAFLDDDDLWAPTKLERQIAEARRTGADMVSCDYVEFYSDGREIVHRPRFTDGLSRIKAISLLHWWSPTSVAIIRKAVFDQTGGFDPRLWSCEDMDMWRRISWRHSIHHVKDILMRYRQGHASKVQQKRRCYRNELQHFRKMYDDTPQDLRWTLPTAVAFLPPRLLGIYGPDWFLALCVRIRPRAQWIKFRQWLWTRTRKNQKYGT